MSTPIRSIFDRFRSYAMRYRAQQRDELQFVMDRPIYGALVAR